MTRPIVAATLQSAFLGAISNVLAQFIAATRHNRNLSIDWIPVFQFLLYAIVNTPPNFLWQEFLESSFPSYPAQRRRPGEKPAPKKRSKRNTLIKFVLDQSIGAVVNTLLFSVFMRTLDAAMGNTPRIESIFDTIRYWVGPSAFDFSRVDFPAIWAAAQAEFWPILKAGWRLWPAVSLINFTLVDSVEGRNLVGSSAGVVWGIYMSFVAATK
jgi:hypothetical protein